MLYVCKTLKAHATRLALASCLWQPGVPFDLTSHKAAASES